MRVDSQDEIVETDICKYKTGTLKKRVMVTNPIEKYVGIVS